MKPTDITLEHNTNYVPEILSAQELLGLHARFSKLTKELDKKQKQHQKLKETLQKEIDKTVKETGDRISIRADFTSELPTMKFMKGRIELFQDLYLMAVMQSNIQSLMDIANSGQNPDIFIKRDSRTWPDPYGRAPYINHFSYIVIRGDVKGEELVVQQNSYDHVFGEYDDYYEARPVVSCKWQVASMPRTAEILADILLKGSKIKTQDNYTLFTRLFFNGTCGGCDWYDTHGGHLHFYCNDYAITHELKDGKTHLESLQWNEGSKELKLYFKEEKTK